MKKGNLKMLMVGVMLGVMMMLGSCYHRHNAKPQHAALVEYSDKQRDSISFSTTCTRRHQHGKRWERN